MLNQADYNQLIEQVEDETAQLLTTMTALQKVVEKLPNDIEVIYWAGRSIEALKPQYQRIIATRKRLQLTRSDMRLTDFFSLVTELDA